MILLPFDSLGKSTLWRVAKGIEFKTLVDVYTLLPFFTVVVHYLLFLSIQFSILVTGSLNLIMLFSSASGLYFLTNLTKWLAIAFTTDNIPVLTLKPSSPYDLSPPASYTIDRLSSSLNNWSILNLSQPIHCRHSIKFMTSAARVVFFSSPLTNCLADIKSYLSTNFLNSLYLSFCSFSIAWSYSV